MCAIRAALVLICSSLLCLSSAQSYGWGQTGHRAVCQIAYDLLSKDHQRTIDRLLQTLPTEHVKALNNFQQREPNAAFNFADSCLWPDAIRGMDEYKSFSSWHYVNADRKNKPIDYSHCLKGCVVQAIPTHMRVLQQSSSRWHQAQALMFLGHWLGDIHQPMHAGFADDWGGNKIMAIANKQRINIHSAWDSWIIHWAMDDYQWSEQVLIKNIASISTKNYPLDYTNEAPLLWADESRIHARHPSVRYCEVNTEQVCERPKRLLTRLDDDYFSEHWPTVAVRLKLGGERLANAIAAALAN